MIISSVFILNVITTHNVIITTFNGIISTLINMLIYAII